MTQTTTNQPTTGRTNRGNVEFTVPAGTAVEADPARSGQVTARLSTPMVVDGERGAHWVYGPEEAFTTS